MFKFIRSCILCIPLVSQVLASSIMVPLYIYPANAPACTAWKPLITAISANPSVTFYIIIDPLNGPGKAASQPNDDYAGCVPKLVASNTKVLGYIDTDKGKRPATNISQDILTYSGWNSTYRPTGIFFDQANTISSLYGYYSANSGEAKKHGFNYTVLNPGTPISDPRYFSFADQIVTIENFYKDFSTSQLVIDANHPAKQQAVLLHDAPSTLPISLINTLVSKDKVGSVLITDVTSADDNPYGAFASYWASFVAANS